MRVRDQDYPTHGRFAIDEEEAELTGTGRFKESVQDGNEIRGESGISPRLAENQLLEKMGYGLAFAHQFLFRLAHHLPAEIAYFKAFNHFPLTIFGGDRKGVDDVLVDTIGITG